LVEIFLFPASAQTGSASHYSSYPMGVWANLLGQKETSAWYWTLTFI